MKKRLTRGEKWLFIAPLLFLVIAGVAWQWREAAPAELRLPSGPYVNALEYAPDGKRLAVILNYSNRGTGLLPFIAYNFRGAVYDLKSRSLVCQLAMDSPTALGKPKPSLCLRFNSPSWSPDGNSIVADVSTSPIPVALGAKSVNLLRIWDARDGRIQNEQPLQFINGWPSGKFRFSSDGQTLIGGGIPTARFHVPTGNLLNKPDKSVEQEFSKGNEPLTLVASRSSSGKELRVVDLKTKRVVWKPAVKNVVEFDWYGDWLCVKDVVPKVGQPYILNHLLLWNGKTRQQLPSPPLPNCAEIGSFRFNPAGKTLFYAYGQSTHSGYQAAVVAWDYRANRVQWRNDNISAPLFNLQPSPDGQWVMALNALGNNSDSGYDFYLFDANGQLHSKNGPIGYATRWSPDSTQLATVVREIDSSKNVSSNRIVFHHFKEE